MTLDRTQRQLLGITKWRDSGCRGTLQWCTGVGTVWWYWILSLDCFKLINFNYSIIMNFVCNIFYIFVLDINI